MSSEVNVLKAIHKHGGEVSLKKLAQAAGFGIDYTRYLLNHLLKKKLVVPSRKGRDWFKLSLQGEKQLNAPLIMRVARQRRRKSPRMPRAPLKANLAKESREEIASPALFEGGNGVLVHNLNEDAERLEELNAGKAIEKTAKVLRGLSAFFASLKNKK